MKAETKELWGAISRLIGLLLDLVLSVIALIQIVSAGLAEEWDRGSFWLLIVLVLHLDVLARKAAK